MAEEIKSESTIDRIVQSIDDFMSFHSRYLDPEDMCFRIAVNRIYRDKLKSYQAKNPREQISNLNVIGKVRSVWNDGDLENFKLTDVYLRASQWVHKTDIPSAKDILRGCLQKANAKKKKEVSERKPAYTDESFIDEGGPFDKRLTRLFKASSGAEDIKIPYSTRYSATATGGYFANAASLKEAGLNNDAQEKALEKTKEYANDPFFKGVPALMNTYALTRLYGTDGGKRLINKRGERRWYEVDEAIGENNMNVPGYSSMPTTSTLISWGNADPYGRTPYHFTDFVFCKYWNKIENNRLITLRRYGAPILDNLKFPGMDGVVSVETSSQQNNKIAFPPMASAVTYFGGESGNSLTSLLKFTTGLNWGDVKSNVWEVGAQETPEVTSGPGKFFGGISTMSKMLNIAGGDFNPELLMNSGNLPPDPYKDGPYENRILGPINRIDSVKRREAGLAFEWSGLTLNFEYVSRPIGGINPKSIILDILSNFLVIGSASAVFFGGQHRFMANPARYPFLGGDKGIEQWYAGRPYDWAKSTLSSFVTSGKKAVGESNISITSFFNNLFKGNGGFFQNIGTALESLLQVGASKNAVTAYLAEKTAGQVPYLTGLKALLTGEPVGEWHLTIGNPLNPIAMIGNLICTGVEVEFGEELGPDDFPTSVKFTVKLDHGMPRDKDAIQSIFNRGMGRIYDLPDEFLGSADGVTKVDKYTAKTNVTGTADPIVGWLASSGTTGGNSSKPVIKAASNSGANSVYSSHIKFQSLSPNSSIFNDNGVMMRSSYRAVDWVALKSLK